MIIAWKWNHLELDNTVHSVHSTILVSTEMAPASAKRQQTTTTAVQPNPSHQYHIPEC